MRVLSVKAPHAEAIVDGRKPVENRSWGRTVRGVIAIHRAGSGGAIIGLVRVVDVLSAPEARERFPDSLDLISGPLCWILDSPIRIDPIKCRGHLSLWQISDEYFDSEECGAWLRKAGRAEAGRAEAGRVEAEAGRVEAAAAAAAKPPTGTSESRLLCERISAQSAGTCFLGFSRGKDSIASWLFLREFFPRIIPFHLAAIPHLSFVDESLSYYEQFFGTRILRFISGSTIRALKNLVYAAPTDEEMIDSLELVPFGTHDLVTHLRRAYDLPDAWCAFGISASDSIERRVYVRKNKGQNPRWKTFYPCFDWPKQMVMAEIDRERIALPKDYLLANRSLADVPRYRHLCRMPGIFPEDFQRVKEFFPMIQACLARMEFRAKREGKHD